MNINGILNVNKPEGKTSFNVVAWLRHLTGEKHVGHTGTLDPIATGVLPVCFGQGTRVIQFLMDSSKPYLAEIELGVATDTYDASGNLTNKTEEGYSGSSPVTRTTTYTYNALGQIILIDGPRTEVTDITTFEYYPNDPSQGLNRSMLKKHLLFLIWKPI